MTWVKICGTTNLDDALATVEAGANALGFIFAPSPRRIRPQAAREIVAHLPHDIEKIGVFVNESVQQICYLIAHVGVTGVQLHGDEDEVFVCELRKSLSASQASHPPRLIKALPVNGGFEELAAKLGPDMVDCFLLDSATQVRGGSGAAFDVALVKNFIRRHKTILAGGLTPMRVANMIQECRPWGVDVVSGVEREPGKKNHDKVRAFVAAVRAVEAKTVQARS